SRATISTSDRSPEVTGSARELPAASLSGATSCRCPPERSTRRSCLGGLSITSTPAAGGNERRALVLRARGSQLERPAAAVEVALLKRADCPDAPARGGGEPGASYRQAGEVLRASNSAGSRNSLTTGRGPGVL